MVFVQKKQTEMQKICESFFEKIKDVNERNEGWLNERAAAGYDSDEEKEEETTTVRRSNLAINEKLKAILSKRKAEV